MLYALRVKSEYKPAYIMIRGLRSHRVTPIDGGISGPNETHTSIIVDCRARRLILVCARPHSPDTGLSTME